MLLAGQFLDGVVDLILNRLDERFAFLVQFAVLTEVLTFEFQHFLLLAYDLRFPFPTHRFTEEDLLGLVVGGQHACLLLRGVDLFLPALGQHRQLLIRLLVLRQVLEDIRHVDIRYRLVFCKSRAKT